jgi:hypothetical protein
MPHRSSGRYDAGPLASFRVDDRQQHAVRHSCGDVPRLGMAASNVEPVEGENVVEHQPRVFESRAVLGEVALRLSRVPLELATRH